MEENTAYQNTQTITLTKSSLMKYLFIATAASVLLSIVLGAFFGGITALVVNKVMPVGSVATQGVKVEDEQSAIINSVKSANPAVVSIIISKNIPNTPSFNPLDPFGFLNGGSSGSSGSTNQEVGGGSGFIITSDGYIVTNKHVASDSTSTYTVVTSDGKKYDGKIAAVDPTNDIAILKIDANSLPTVPLGDSSTLQLGQQVIAIGNALGQYSNSVSAGVVSGINRVVTASDSTGSTDETLNNVIQTDAQINPGNSGGPLLNLSGQVIGINTAVAQNAQGIGFAIPIDQAKKDIQSIESTGKIVKPELGVRYEPIDSNFIANNASLNLPYNYGAYVTSNTQGQPAVVSGSPADKAGIKSGDIILQIDGTKVDNAANTLANLVQNHNVGDTISITYYDNGNTKTVSVKLDQSFAQ